MAKPWRPKRVTNLMRIPIQHRIKMCEAQNWRCPDCGKVMDFDASNTDDQPTIEHVIPLWLGGADRGRNMVMICHACNQRIGRTLASLPEFEALELAFTRAGIDDWTEGLKALCRSQTDELVRLRSEVSAYMQRSLAERAAIKSRNKEINELKREVKIARKERDQARLIVPPLWWRGLVFFRLLKRTESNDR
jgi:hypothetical protein